MHTCFLSLSLYLAILPLYSPHMSAICAYAIQREIRECKCTNEQKSCDREEKLNAKTVIIDYTVEQCYCIRYRPNRHWACAYAYNMRMSFGCHCIRTLCSWYVMFGCHRTLHTILYIKRLLDMCTANQTDRHSISICSKLSIIYIQRSTRFDSPSNNRITWY